MFSLTHHSTKNLIADTGASENYIDSNTPANNKIINNNPLQVKLPNGEVLHSTHTELLHLPGIKEEATQAHPTSTDDVRTADEATLTDEQRIPFPHDHDMSL